MLRRLPHGGGGGPLAPRWAAPFRLALAVGPVGAAAAPSASLGLPWCPRRGGGASLTLPPVARAHLSGFVLAGRGMAHAQSPFRERMGRCRTAFTSSTPPGEALGRRTYSAGTRKRKGALQQETLIIARSPRRGYSYFNQSVRPFILLAAVGVPYQFSDPASSAFRRSDAPDTSGENKSLPLLSQPIQFSSHTRTAQVRQPSAIARFFTSLLDSFWTCIRTIELCIRFMPLAITYPLLVKLFPSFGVDLWYRLLGFTLMHSGACFIKLGQWLSTRRDLLPDHLCQHLASLRSQAPSHAFKYTRRQFKEAFGLNLEDVFIEFPSEPIASGAIAQVYDATLREPRGHISRVAVKVRHPHVRETILRDLKILRGVVAFVEQLVALHWLQLQGKVNSFADRMEAQCDLYREAENLLRFKANFQEAPNIRFPEPVEGLCHPLVLVESFEEGQLVETFAGEDIPVELRKTIAAVGMDTYLKMMLVDNFVHADLHPGNILIDDGHSSGREPQVVILDVGLVSQLSEHDRQNFIQLFAAVVAGDSKHAAELITQGQDLSAETIGNFGADMGVLINRVKERPLAEVQMSSVFLEMLALARKHRVVLEPNFTTLVIGTVVVEGIGRQLDPDINLITRAAPMLVKDKDIRDAYIKSSLSRKFSWLSSRHH